MLNTPIKIAKNKYNTLRKNKVAFKKSQEEYLNVITHALMTTRLPKWGGLKVSVIN